MTDKIKVTLKAVKDEVKSDKVIASKPLAIQQNALRSFMNHVRENPSMYEITPRSEKAIEKFIEDMI